MKTVRLLGPLLLLLLAGCGDNTRHENQAAPGYDSAHPKVFVVRNLEQAQAETKDERHGEGKGTGDAASTEARVSDVQPIIVSPPSLYFPITKKEEDPVEIVWSLPVGGGYVFREGSEQKPGSITFPGFDRGEKAEFRCHLGPTTDGLTYTCLNRRSGPGAYKYNIRVYKDGSPADAAPAFVVDPAATNGN